VLVIALAAPVTPFQVVLAAAGSGNGSPPYPGYRPCNAISPIDRSCVPRLQHSCQNAANPGFFGDPPVRLQAVVDQVPFHQTVSICGEDPNRPPDYAPAMRGIGGLMSARMLGGCLFAPPVNRAQPECEVSLVELDGPLRLPSCDDGGPPCWRVVDDARCPVVRNPETGDDAQLRLVVTGAPPEQPVHADCHTFPVQTPDG
jgi:hypothetical protein